MSSIVAEAQRRIPVASEVVYLCIADYKNHHGQFLPKEFIDYRVEEGGFGTGTVISFKGRFAGNVRHFRNKCEETVPGRVLVERDQLSSLVTTTTITPEGEGCTVQFRTVWDAQGGITGLMERLFAPAMLRRIFSRELELLEDYAKRQAKQGAFP
ncbi:SRPBCC family protein [Microvirga terricola]|uniref:SRPBCC family protein n=1 Tax=Microvirga terricola TaxID=2719797 RepID=A0ABX0V9M4_9HYPH|nr:SRPBCC family protein [Microvirga terricola]NIX76540.1 SRPBCC family protein [Microvirga terricola]